MVRSWFRPRLVVVLVVSGSLLASIPAAGRQANDYDQTLARVVRLLPRSPDRIVVLDGDASGHSLQEKLQHVEGFVTHGERVVYLVRQSDTLQQAMKGPGIFDYALAIIIWHEMAHIDGADEAKAREAEEWLWKEFVLAGRVDSARGMKYLALLKNRR